MKTLSRFTAIALAAALSGLIACGDTGCSPPPEDNKCSKNPNQPGCPGYVTPLNCKPGTVEQAGKCVVITNVKDAPRPPTVPIR
jgi:hypothetical protein